jgi:prophage maintenance system killer protein
MQDITLETIVAAHDEVMAAGGGDRRVLSEGNLHQLVFRANLAEDPWERATIVFYSLCAFPPFREGNRRTAARLAETILAAGGFNGRLPCEDLRSLAQGIDAFTVEIEDVEQVLRRCTGPGPWTVRQS